MTVEDFAPGLSAERRSGSGASLDSFRRLEPGAPHAYSLDGVPGSGTHPSRRPQWTALKSRTSIETLKGVFADAGAVVVTHYMGLTVAEMTDLRGRLRKEGAQLQGGEEHPGPEGPGRLGR